MKKHHPVYLNATHYRMDWGRSIERCNEMRRKDEIHGHKLPYKPGDEVIDPTGRVGVLIHKEFLRDEPELGHEIWQLAVQYGAEIKTFSNPSALQKKMVQTKRHSYAASEI